MNESRGTNFLHCAPREACVAARYGALPELLALLSFDAGPGDPAVSQDALRRARVAVEELFTNTIRHGYGGESDNPVWLTVAIDDRWLRLTYADAARRFDPFHGIEHPHEASVENWPVGGLGRLLTREMAQRHRYRREGDRNVIELEYAVRVQQ